MSSRKWKYPDPSFKGEKWYEWPKDIPEDPELENHIYALLKRHSLKHGVSFTHDASLVPLLTKLAYLYKPIRSTETITIGGKPHEVDSNDYSRHSPRCPYHGKK